jgi:hypothetical protein
MKSTTVGCLLAAAALALPSAASAAEIPATPVTLGSAFAAANAGDTVLLASGDYGTFGGGMKAGTVTLRPQPGATATMRVDFDPAANIRLDGLTIPNLNIEDTRTHDITVSNSRFIGAAVIRTEEMVNANILFDRNTHAGIDKCGDCYEGRITLPGKTSQPSGVTIQNSIFGPGGVSDGIQNGGNGVHILGNEFVALQGGSVDGVHVDAIQLYGSSNTVIRGNWLHDVATGIMAPDGMDHEVIEHNVIDTQGYPFAITLGSDNGSIVRHNTMPDRACWFNLRCGIVVVENKSGQPVSQGTVITDNVMGEISVKAGTLGGRSHNLLANGSASGPSEIKGKPTYKGGPNANAWLDFALAPGSLGKGDASDGTDRGAAILGPLGTPIPAGPPAAPTPSPGAPSRPSGAATSGLVAAYGFDERRGRRVRDASGGGHGGRIKGARHVKVAHSGRALAFDGRNDVVKVRDADALDLSGAMTVEAWVRTTSRGRGWRTVVAKRRGKALSYGLFSSDRSGRPSAVAGRSARGRAKLRRKRWMHLAVTYDGSALRLFVNGRLARQRARTGKLRTGRGALLIGGITGRGRHFKGQIDDVRIYNRALGRDELRVNMRAPV